MHNAAVQLPDSLLFTEWIFSNDYIGGHWISHSKQVAKLLRQERTHDPISCLGRRGVRSGDEWWSAGVASVEAGHGRKTGIDVWRDWVCGVILEDEKQKCFIFSPKCGCVREKERADLYPEFYFLLWGCDEVKVTGRWEVQGSGGRDKERAGSICRLPVMPSQLKADRRTRPDQTLTQRGSAVSLLIITRPQLKSHTSTPTVQSGWRAGKDFTCCMWLTTRS